MLWAIILPIFRSTRLCVTACGVMHPRCCRLPAGNIVGALGYTTSCNTQSSAPEDGQNNCPKRVELTGIINKQLLLHLVGCLYYLFFIIYLFACFLFLDLLNNLNLTLNLKTCRIWWAPNNASKWQRDLIRRLKINVSELCHRTSAHMQAVCSITYLLHGAEAFLRS